MAETHQADNEICQRYAHAFLELAAEKKCLEAVAGDLQSLGKALEDSADLREAITNPAYSKEQLTAAFNAIMKKGKMDELTHKFVNLLITKRRLNVLHSIIRSFMSALAHLRGEIRAEVTIASDLSAGESKKLDEVLKKIVSKKITIATKKDESLIGGFIVRVGSKMIDVSTKTQLLTLANSMKG